jgi:hypothetical protein
LLTVKLSPQGAPVICTSLSNDRLQSAKGAVPLLVIVRLAVKPPAQVEPPSSNFSAELPPIRTDVATAQNQVKRFYKRQPLSTNPKKGIPGELACPKVPEGVVAHHPALGKTPSKLLQERRKLPTIPRKAEAA